MMAQPDSPLDARTANGELRLSPIRPPRSIPCVVCGHDRLYVLEGTPPPRRRSLLRWSRYRRVGTARCDECGAR